MKDCRNCGNAIYDPNFGDRRCVVYNHDIRDLDKYLDCGQHKDKDVDDENHDS